MAAWQINIGRCSMSFSEYSTGKHCPWLWLRNIVIKKYTGMCKRCCLIYCGCLEIVPVIRNDYVEKMVGHESKLSVRTDGPTDFA